MKVVKHKKKRLNKKKINKNFDKIFSTLKEVLFIVKEFIIKNRKLFYMAFPFVAMDVFTRILGNSINFYKIYRLVPNLFTFLWAFLFIGIALSFKKIVSKIIYLFINILFIIMFLVNNVYYSTMSNFFNFSLLSAVGEGTPYFIDAITNCNIWVYICLLVIIVLVIFGYKNIPNTKSFNQKRLAKVFIVFFLCHTITPIFLGRANSDLVWSTWKNPRNVYNLFNDSNKSMRVSGLFEYSFRDFYVAFLKKEKENTNDLIFLEEIFATEKPNTKNSYTGKYVGKNLIFLQLEGIDSWLLNEQDTPVLYSMMTNSINFSDHYSFYNGGGSTFNSEFAVNTGFVVPLSYNQNAYSFNNNYFPYSMATLFKNLGYSVNAFHMNYGEYYSRSINYKNWKYDNYYGLVDMYKYNNNEHQLDREMILNTEYSDLMFPADSLFVDYLITYSSHLPFTNTKGVCKQLYDLDNAEKLVADPNYEVEFVEMSEEECVRRQVKETDYMVQLLLDKLKEKGLYENTVIVVFTDHYLYTLEDPTILDKYKETSNNLINKTPFFIFDGSTKATIKKTNSQLNILPTVLNLFGIDYNPNYYIGEDILLDSYKGIVFFSDYSWYNGNVYVEGGEVTNGGSISNEDLETNNYLINYWAKKNDLILKYNYFKKISDSNKKKEEEKKDPIKGTTFE